MDVYDFRFLFEQLILEQESQTFEKALQSPHSKKWQDAINARFQSLLKNNTLEIYSITS
jgi:hypothetical protein